MSSKCWPVAKGLNSSLILPLQYQNKMNCRIKHWWMHSLTSAWQFLNEPWILLCDKRAHNLEFQIMDFWYWHREKYMTNIAGQRSIEIRLSTWHCAFLSIKGLASITGVHILRMTPIEFPLLARHRAVSRWRPHGTRPFTLSRQYMIWPGATFNGYIWIVWREGTFCFHTQCKTNFNLLIV